MKIGILGSGNVGKALSKGLAMSGHRVVVSSREPDHPKHASWTKETGRSVGMVAFDEAARFGETMILALPWGGLEDVLETIDPAYLKHKTVIDVSNAVYFDGGPRLLHNETSAGEIVQQLLPDSFVVKTLNTVSDQIMAHPHFSEGSPVMLMSGNNLKSKEQVRTLLKDLGWSTVIDLGDISRSRLQESMMIACVISEKQLQAPGAAFALLTR
ncbi:hypothetical protein FHS19_006180 [Paenibacillus rhizosphaerae]|uniref:Pyrroline-5-carboxylate reductase catalytic N-terminal domain-containing protein n=1 Tax=Paenibacillus rhizosphaerae TaxID=297318 RepID=A0A839U3M2_9BACL|nr:NAD(P)-binding domain-containing protein [Paenibacillus rhizosphaerae]MBB3131457.1 hypothetical protein [Paenibacillus rhizosphaerae]